MLPNLMMLWCTVVAAPNADGHYHPDGVAGRSKTFATAADALGPQFEQTQKQLTRAGASLQEMEVGSGLLGAKLDSSFRDWANEQRKLITGQFIQVQRHVDVLQEDVGRVFTEALERAISQAGANWRPCKQASGVQALMRRSPSTCPGVDQNARLAELIDADPAVTAAVNEITAIPFPVVGAEDRAWDAITITGKERWVSAHALGEQFAAGSIQRAREQLEAALAPVEAQIAAGNREAVHAASAARKQYEASLESIGLTLIEASEEALTKAKVTGVGVCPNPRSLGGCTGEDSTKEILSALSENKRFLRSVQDL